MPPSLGGCNDLPALEQLARALWRREGQSGAAVLIGAGLSRSAKLSSDDTLPPPLWSDLAADMAVALYPRDKNAAPWDPLRLAEEYRTYFGQAALDDFIRQRIRDASWQPSPDHIRLLSLPWSDVLTTNYDTLLERAARNCGRAYEPVRAEHEIAFARAPRIIKLHGSIGVSNHFIIAEEDYRKYPTQQAAFVNLARQCFIENELCLIGFSGDDPNFLAWAGWVRDHLGRSARRIYLAGALNLSPAKRKYLEARNIAPIDVYVQVETLERDKRHGAATQLILDALQALKPAQLHEWQPAHETGVDHSADEATNLATMQAMLVRWRNERLSYPGWVVCPKSVRDALRYASPLPNKSMLEKLAPAEAAEMIREWCWRHQTALWPIQPAYVTLIRTICDPRESPDLDKAGRLEIASVLLDHADDEGDDVLFEEMANLIETQSQEGDEVRTALDYRRARRALRDMDFATAFLLAHRVTGEDPAWRLRRAALLTDLGHLEQAEELVSDTLADLREREWVDRSSVWIRSRLAWATFLHNAYRRDKMEFEPWPERFRESQCDPWKEIEALQGEVVSARREKLSKLDRPKPNFQPGSYHLPGPTIHFGDSKVEPSDQLIRLLEAGGVPARLEHVNFFAADRIEALELSLEPTLRGYLELLSAGLTVKDRLFDHYFSRVSIAAMDESVANGLMSRIRRAISFWQNQLTATDNRLARFSSDRLLFLVTLLGRLSIRLSDEMASALHFEMVSLQSHPHLGHPRYDDAFQSVLSNSYGAVSPKSRLPLIIADLHLPLQDKHRGPDPASWLSALPQTQAKRNPALRNAVAFLLDEVKKSGNGRGPAIRRLICLNKLDAINRRELQSFSKLAWSKLDSGVPSLPADAFVFDYIWAAVPAPAGDASTIVRARIYNTLTSIDEDRLRSMLYAAEPGGLFPEHTEAAVLFDIVASLRYQAVDQDDIGAVIASSFRGYNVQENTKLAGLVLGRALAPALAIIDRTRARFEAVERVITETGTLFAIEALVPFIGIENDADSKLETMIRRGLTSPDSDEGAISALTILRWVGEHPSGVRGIPSQLLDQLVSVIEIRQSPALATLLQVAESLTQQRRLSVAHRRRLRSALADLESETDYRKIDPFSDIAGRISLIRQSAVRLASQLGSIDGDDSTIMAWKLIAQGDPLPEVRHSLDWVEA